MSKPLVPIGKAGDLLAHLLTLLCKGMSHKKVGAMWRRAGLSWKDFLSEDEDVNKFVTEKGVDYTLGEEYGKVGSIRESLSETLYKVDSKEIFQRAKLLQRYMSRRSCRHSALQSLVVQMEQPPIKSKKDLNYFSLCELNLLYNEDIIKEDGFYKWESSKDPAEQQGKGIALKSVTAFFTRLREAEDESDNS
ncbi:eukaryotic translation initiation factor 4 gamma 1 isoform X1 [Tachysurus ichikawai]